MSLNVTVPADSKRDLSTLARPGRLHHTAYVTHDVEATVKFYTEVLGMPLVSAVVDDAVPSTGDPWPYLHLFFQLGDGSTLAFFESIGLPQPSAPSHPAYEIFNHIALDVGSPAEVDRWIERLKAHGVDCIGPVEHGIIYSVYFRDPNGIRLELTADVDPDWATHAAEAQADVQSWLEAKRRGAAEGDGEAVLKWVKQHRAKHKS